MATGTAPLHSSILIVGSGVFGLSTAYALAQRPAFRNTKITLIERLEFPASDASSIDSSRIIRPDYADGAYAALMAEGMPLWRGEFGAEGRYTEAGLCLVTDETADDNDEDAHYYLVRALENVTKRLGLRVGKREAGGQVELMETPEAVQRVMASMGGDCGRRGYVNWTSGWADAEAGVRHMRKLVEATGRVQFRTAEVRRLRFGEDKVEAVELVNGEVLTADLIALATGAWTPKLIDLRGIASATGQILAYLDLTQPEQDRLGSNPTLLCESNGMFIIQPRNRVLKVARHGYGYANPTCIPHPERPESGETITVSLPRTKQDDPYLDIAPEGDKACREYLAKTIPSLADRPWTYTRICWYTDTPKGDWLISYHPKYSNLFVATGGSGHAYKFLPVVGERIVDVIQGVDRDELGKELRAKWAWPSAKWKEDHIWTDDWRGGKKGMVLDEELARS
ncbi:hypothetical protein BAUCODRAFT_151280 [Baudoinia panamericana UAMH 10762]|uniref:FAD dependent oxidoreductase domain-containing protein n=1 Tax=Baudoinia panamericana (strain UAMH 10762) TaxID=717646 RepID=M2LFS7_BAUPA|nr:uncharacterized protein BAUCODRAFT_151280 [Baudoinia panamericana UAMH 10762]EMC92887.1 hypothetical protein BAUCODRAFT_151280 [Baudoinia panamericana UAMH 10762]